VESAVQPEKLGAITRGANIVAETRDLQDSNAPLVIEVTLEGMVIDVRPEPLNADPSIRVTLSGMVNEVRDVQF
jgi:hypothetical protein